eukprot:8625150-Pyramimonas_sp.AAC.1
MAGLVIAEVKCENDVGGRCPADTVVQYTSSLSDWNRRPWQPNTESDSSAVAQGCFSKRSWMKHGTRRARATVRNDAL